MKILVVEDDPVFSNLLKESLSAQGHQIFVAADALSGTTEAIHRKPDVVLLDLKIPAGNGLMVLERLKKNDQTRHIPVIMITSYADRDDIQKAYELGVHKALAKPIKLEELTLLLNELPPPKS